MSSNSAVLLRGVAPFLIRRGQKTGDPILVTAGNQFDGPILLDTSKQSVVCIATDVVGFSATPRGAQG